MYLQCQSHIENIIASLTRECYKVTMLHTVALTCSHTHKLVLPSSPHLHPPPKRHPHRVSHSASLSLTHIQRHTQWHSRFPLSLPVLSGLAGSTGSNQHSRKPQGPRLWGFAEQQNSLAPAPSPLWDPERTGRALSPPQSSLEGQGLSCRPP